MVSGKVIAYGFPAFLVLIGYLLVSEGNMPVFSNPKLVSSGFDLIYWAIAITFIGILMPIVLPAKRR